MNARGNVVVDGNEAVASVAYRASEVIAIYPITPSSAMGELSDEWAVAGRRNLWGAVPEVVEMQSEGGAAGAVHGALQAGALTTTFTSSQGLLLMIPAMFKIAGELNPFCMHVAARTLATHALSIFGDHSDVMAVRSTGFALLASGSVQEAQDLAAIAHAATLESRIPFLHFFDGFRTSHELAKIETLSDADLAGLLPDALVTAHRARALTPDHPVLRGTAQNPDTFFQAREACNSFYDACPEIVRDVMERFAGLTGRRYRLFDYAGHPEAERVVVLMGSGGETAEQTVRWLAARGERAGVVRVRLFRPFALSDFVAALPPTVRAIAVLDRTKEPGAVGDPLFVEIEAALREAADAGLLNGRPQARMIAGRYGLSSKEFTPAMVKAALDECDRPSPRRRFTVGIVDDVTHLSLDPHPDFEIEPDDEVRAVFYGLGADGTVGANKNTAKILGEEGDRHVQGYFVYDSKKSGAVTVSHLRFGPRPIRAPYLIRSATFVACHQFEFVERMDVLEFAAKGATLLLNAPYAPEDLWDHLPREMQETILERGLRLFVIDAGRVAREAALGGRINTIMQACFFSLANVLPRDEALAQIRVSIRKTYEKKGPEIVQKNFAAIDRTLENLHPVPLEGRRAGAQPRPALIPEIAPEFVQRVTAVILANQGDRLPVSAFPVDGTWPLGTSRWEKRNIATEIPAWDPSICIQCNKCAFVCPHAAIRAKVYEPDRLAGAPQTFRSQNFRGQEFEGWRYTIQVAPEDCTGCRLCVEVCPAKDKSNPRHKAIDMVPQRPIREAERENFAFFLDLPEPPRERLALDNKGSQLVTPLFEFSGACGGCGETPYLKLLTQLFGDRLLIANATGCSSIYGGNLPTTPYTVNREGRGPAWSNSLFENNAEFGLGLRLAVDAQARLARLLVEQLADRIGGTLAAEILGSDRRAQAEIEPQRRRVAALQAALVKLTDPRARRLEAVAESLVPRSVWLVGGDGWAYDIGFGGLDHVLASGRDVNVLVLDTEVYSNTGGQQSKATPLGAAAKFAAAGKETAKKDLGMIAMAYGNIYVARVAFGAKDAQTVRAFAEAEAYPGPSLIIAYSHCIAHGFDLSFGAQQQKLAVDSGVWPLYRFDPRRAAQGLPPLQLDCGSPKIDPAEYMRNETRFRITEKTDPPRYQRLLHASRQATRQRWSLYQDLAGIKVPQEIEAEPEVAGRKS